MEDNNELKDPTANINLDNNNCEAVTDLRQDSGNILTSSIDHSFNVTGDCLNSTTNSHKQDDNKKAYSDTSTLDDRPNHKPALTIKDDDLQKAKEQHLERIRYIKERQELVRKRQMEDLLRKKDEIKGAMMRSEEFRKKQDEERRARIEVYRRKEEERRLSVEERRKKLMEEELERKQALLRKHQEKALLKPSGNPSPVKGRARSVASRTTQRRYTELTAKNLKDGQTTPEYNGGRIMSRSVTSDSRNNLKTPLPTKNHTIATANGGNQKNSEAVNSEGLTDNSMRRSRNMTRSVDGSNILSSKKSKHNTTILMNDDANVTKTKSENPTIYNQMIEISTDDDAISHTPNGTIITSTNEQQGHLSPSSITVNNIPSDGTIVTHNTGMNINLLIDSQTKSVLMMPGLEDNNICTSQLNSCREAWPEFNTDMCAEQPQTSTSDTIDTIIATQLNENINDALGIYARQLKNEQTNDINIKQIEVDTSELHKTLVNQSDSNTNEMGDNYCSVSNKDANNLNITDVFDITLVDASNKINLPISMVTNEKDGTYHEDVGTVVEVKGKNGEEVDIKFGKRLANNKSTTGKSNDLDIMTKSLTLPRSHKVDTRVNRTNKAATDLNNQMTSLSQDNISKILVMSTDNSKKKIDTKNLKIKRYTFLTDDLKRPISDMKVTEANKLNEDNLKSKSKVKTNSHASYRNLEKNKYHSQKISNSISDAVTTKDVAEQKSKLKLESNIKDHKMTEMATTNVSKINKPKSDIPKSLIKDKHFKTSDMQESLKISKTKSKIDSKKIISIKDADALTHHITNKETSNGKLSPVEISKPIPRKESGSEVSLDIKKIDENVTIKVDEINNKINENNTVTVETKISVSKSLDAVSTNELTSTGTTNLLSVSNNTANIIETETLTTMATMANDTMVIAATVAVVNDPPKKLSAEEEMEARYKSKLAENRRLAREKADREAEELRIRIEEEKRQEELRIQQEEEEQKRQEEQELRLVEEARRQETERLRQAMQLAEEKKKADEEKAAQERKEKLEAEQRSAEESERREKEKKEKSTDCDSALIPLLCVHG